MTPSTLTWTTPMPGDESAALLDTNVVILRGFLSPGTLHGTLSVSAITLAELSAGFTWSRATVRRPFGSAPTGPRSWPGPRMSSMRFRSAPMQPGCSAG